MKRVMKFFIVIFIAVIIVSMVIYANSKRSAYIAHADETYRLALNSIKANQPDSAIILSKEILLASPGYTDALVVMGRGYMMKQQYPAAKKALELALTRDKKNPDVHRYLASIAIVQRDTAGAILHIDKYLDLQPGDKEMLVKKYYLLLQSSTAQESQQAIDEITRQLPDDSLLRQVNHNYYYDKATNQRKNGNHLGAAKNYEKALKYNADDTDAMRQLVNVGMMHGNYLQADRYNKKLLSIVPGDVTYLMTASDIYAATGQKNAAIAYAAKAMQANPGNAKAREHFVDVCLLFCKNATPAEVVNYAGMALDVDRSNKLALTYYINANAEMKEYNTALLAVNTALKQYPGDVEFTNKKIGILYSSGNIDGTTTYLVQMMQTSKFTGYRTQYAEIQQLVAKEAILNKDYVTAENAIDKGLNADVNNRLLKEQLVTVYNLQGRQDDAIMLLDGLIASNPGNARYRFRKAGILEAQRKYADAAAITKALHTRYPANDTYRMAYVNQLLGVSKQAQEQQEYEQAIAVNKEVLQVDMQNYIGYLYQSNTYFANGDEDSALGIVNVALVYYPVDSLLWIKKSSLLQANGRHVEALQTIYTLNQKYPQDTALFAIYLDEMNNAGKYYQRSNQWDSSLNIFRTSYSYAPNDTFVLQNLSAIFFVQRKYDSVVYYASKGLQVHPYDQYLLLKKASAQEQLKQYNNAAATAKILARVAPDNKIYRDYADMLLTRSHQNEVGFSRLQSYYRESGQRASITSMHYTRRFNGGSLTGRVNYAERFVATGLQGEIEAYLQHGSKFYSNALVAFADTRAFPTLKLNYSLFMLINKSWEGELGARYMYAREDSTRIISGVASVGKYAGNAWINLRGFLTSYNKDLYSSFVLTGHYYVNDKKDYAFATFGLGTTPDDRSLQFNYNRIAGFKTRSVGAGYKKNLRHGFSVIGSATWYNRKLNEVNTQNQVDLNIAITKGF